MARFERGFPAETIFENSREVYIDEQGVPRSGINIAGSAELVEQYRQGYRCLRCHHVQSVAFPEECEARDKTVGGTWKCGFRMRDDQIRFLEAEHQGEHRYGPTPLSAFDDEREREAWVPKTGIYLPRGWDA